MSTLKFEYKGKTIEYRDHAEDWAVQINGETVTLATVKLAKDYVDKIEKKGFKRIKIIKLYRDDTGILSGEITSVVHSTGYGGTPRTDIWVSFKNGREKLRQSPILDTPKNREILKSIIEKEKQRTILSDEIRTLDGSLDYFKSKDQADDGE